MTVFLLTRDELTRMLKILAIYAVAVLLGAISGLLPLISLLAGLPILLAGYHISVTAGRLLLPCCLLVNWIMLDPLSFIVVGIGVTIGYFLLHWYASDKRIAVGYRSGFIGAVLWLSISNVVTLWLEKKNLLAVLLDTLSRTFAAVVKNMQDLDIYSAEQLEMLDQFQEAIMQSMQQNWPVFVFIFVFLSITFTLLWFGRHDRQVAEQFQWRQWRAPAWLAIATMLTTMLMYVFPQAAPWLVSNIFGIGTFLLFLSGAALLYFYLQHWRMGWIVQLLAGLLILTNPFVLRIMVLVGTFDALFDYRYYARSRS
jgi:hypothetical protein